MGIKGGKPLGRLGLWMRKDKRVLVFMADAKLILGDCLQEMKKLPDNSIDLVILDPPYNIGIDEWDKIKSSDKYLVWLEQIINEVIRLTKSVSSIYIFGDYHFIAEIKMLMNKFDVKLISWIIWDKGAKEQNAIRSYANIVEHILFFARPKNQLNNQIWKYLNQAREKKGLSLSDINKALGWASNGGGCASGYMGNKESVIIPNENHYNKLKKLMDLEKDYHEFIGIEYTFNHEDIRIIRNRKDKRKYTYDRQILPNIWYFNDKSEMAMFEHSTVKPLELIKTIIKASSNTNDLVLDPFLGSGTTGVACAQLGRNFIGIEIDPKYFAMAQKRIAEWEGQERLV